MEKRIELERRGKEPGQIKELNLDNTRATQIEGLTNEYVSLETLSLINVGLTCLKGFPKLPSLQKLELSDNRISDGLSALKDCPKLSHLNLSGNKIKDLKALEPLKSFDSLTHLDLFNNEICDLDDYRTKLFKLLPSLKYLDDADADENEEEAEESDGDHNGALFNEGSSNDELSGEEECSEEEDEGPGLSAIYNDNLEDDEDGEDYDEEDGEEDDDDEIEEEEDSGEPKGKKMKVVEEGGATAENGEGSA